MRTLKKIKRRLLAMILCLCMILSSNTFENTAYTMESSTESSTASETTVLPSELGDGNGSSADGAETSSETSQDVLGGGYSGITEQNPDSAADPQAEQDGWVDPNEGSGMGENEEQSQSSNDSSTGEIGSGGQTSAARILSFIALKNEVLRQEYLVGTAREALNLPSELEVEIQDKSETVKLPVKWTSEPEFDGNTEGEYVFKAKLKDDAEDETDYELADEIEFPAITVSIVADENDETDETETTGETETESETETISETETESETESISETETESETEPISETETESETESISEAETESETETISETETESETETISETETESETEPISETETENKTEPVSETESESETETESESVEAIAYALNTMALSGAGPNGSLTIIKRWTGGPEGANSDGTWHFKVRFTDEEGNPFEAEVPEESSWERSYNEEDGVHYVSISADESWTAVVPIGTVYTVEEIDANLDYYTTTVIESGRDVGDPSDGAGIVLGDVTVTFTDELEASGNLKVTKKITNEDDEYKEWELKVTLKDESGKPVKTDALWTIGDDAGWYSDKSDEGIYILELCGGNSGIIGGLPVGTKYTVEENLENLWGDEKENYKVTIEENGGNVGDDPTDGKGTITGNDTVQVTVTNIDKEEGSLTVTKRWTGGPEGIVSDALWHFWIKFEDAEGDSVKADDYKGSYDSCSYYEGKGAYLVKLSADESWTASGLPLGTKYVVTEEEAGQDHHKTTITENGGITGEYSDDGKGEIEGNVEVKFTNELEASGNLIVTKRLIGKDEDTWAKRWKIKVELQNSEGAPVSAGAVWVGSTDYDEDTGWERSGSYIGSIDKDTGTYIFYLCDGDRGVLGGLPVGTQYTVREILEDDEDNYTVTIKESGGYIGEDSTDGEGTITDNDSVNVAVTNTCHTGDLTIIKRWTGGETSHAIWDFTVELKDADGNPIPEIQCHYNWEKTYPLKNSKGTYEIQLTKDQRWTVNDLPVGTQYTITEDAANEEYHNTTITEKREDTGSVISSDGIGKIDAGNVEVTFLNELEASGALVVTKSLAGGLSKGDKNKEWHFTITLEDENGYPLKNGDYVKCDKDGKATSKTVHIENGVLEVVLKDGESFGVRLPDGIIYTVTEAEADKDGYATFIEESGVWSGAKKDDGEGEIIANGVGTVAFTNEKDFGKLEIAKRVTGNAADEAIKSGRKWDFEIYLTDASGTPLTDVYDDLGDDVKVTPDVTDPGKASFSLSDGKKLTIPNLPYGTRYTVKEFLYDDSDGNCSTTVTGDGKWEYRMETDAENNRIAVCEGVITKTENEENITHVTYTNTISKPVKTEPSSGTDFPKEGEDGTLVYKLVKVGDQITYQIGYKNDSPAPMTIVIRDVLDEGVDFVSASEPFTYDSNTVVWTLEDVPAAGKEGSEGFVTLTVVVNENAMESGRIKNQAFARFGNAVEQQPSEVVKNPVTGSLTVSKTVAGTAKADSGKFHFKVTLLNHNDIEGWYGTTESGMRFLSDLAGSYAEFDLKDGESKTAVGLPIDTQYTVTETGNEGYNVTPVNSSATSELKNSNDGNATVAFTNTRNYATAHLKVRKNLTGMGTDSGNYSFTFVLTPQEVPGQPNNPIEGAVSKPVTVSAAGKWTADSEDFFKDVSFKEEGTYRYVLEEQSDSAFYYIHYDQTKYDVVVTVSHKDKEPGTLTAEVQVTPQSGTGTAGSGTSGGTDNVKTESDTKVVVYNNAYNPTPATASLYVKKIMDVGTHGDHLEPKTFQFRIQPIPQDGQPANPMKPEGVQTSVTVGTRESGSDERQWTVTDTTNLFYGIKFTEPGTYVYELKEVHEENSPGMHYDDATRIVTVEVTDGPERELSAQVTVTKNNEVEPQDPTGTVAFTNEYNPSKASVTLKGKKTYSGGSLSAGDFTVVLTALSVSPSTHSKGIPMPGKKMANINGEGQAINNANVSCEVQNGGDTNDTFNIGNIEFDTIGTYTYSLKEKKDSSKTHIKYDDTEYIITVVVTEQDLVHGVAQMNASVTCQKKINGQLVGSPESYGENVLSFTNICLGSLKVEKHVSGTAASGEDEFDFTVTLKDNTISGWYGPGDESAPQSGDGMYFDKGVAHITLKNGENRQADNLPYGTGYTVAEDDSGDYAASVSVSGADAVAAMQASGQIPANAVADVVFTNKKDIATAAIRATKVFPGEAPATESFTFVLAADHVENAAVSDIPMPGSTSAPVDLDGNVQKGADGKPVPGAYSRKTAAVGEFEFDSITYKHTGTYYYTLTEEPGTASEIAYDTAVYDVRVVVTGTNGQLEATVSYRQGSGEWKELGGADLPVFTNRMKATASLKVEKTLAVGPHGHHLDPKTFTFTLTPDEGTEVQPAYNSITVEVARDAAKPDAESWTRESALDFFDGVYFEKGTYTYTLDESETNPYPGVHYDQTKYEVVVDVTEAQDGSLQAEVTLEKVTEAQNGTLQAVVMLNGQGADNTAVAIFENSYEPTKASVTLQGRKVLEGGTFARGEFTFVLSADKNTPWPDNPAKQQLTVGADGAWTYEVANASDKTFTFGRITFEKTGTYIYYISEKKDASRTDIAYDDATYKVTVVVEEGTINGEDTHAGVTSMTRTVSYEKDGKPVSLEDGHVTFTNKLKTGNLTVSKTVTGNAGEPEKAWNFTVTLKQNGEPASISGTYGDMTFQGGIASFTLTSGAKKTATGLPAGTAYEVSETEANKDGYKTASVAASGQIAADQTKEAAFTNTREPAILSLDVSKRLENDTLLKAGDFAFKLEALDGAPMPAAAGTNVELIRQNGAGVADGTVSERAADASVDFGGITYTKPGVYQYKITEIPGTDTGVDYDETEYYVTVTVSCADGEGKLTAAASYSNTSSVPGTGSSAVFTNKRLLGDLTVEKTVSGDAKTDPENAGKEFSFKVTLDRTDISGTYGDMEFTADANGSYATFRLADYGRVKAVGLPVGTVYTVTETDHEGYRVTHTGKTGEEAGNVAVGIIPSPTGGEQLNEVTVAFTNTRNYARAELQARKNLLGADDDDSRNYPFAFVLTPVVKDARNDPANPLTLPQKLSAEVNANGKWTAVTGNFLAGTAFRVKGNYYYTLAEEPGEDSSVLYDTKAYDIKVEVKEETEGSLTAEVFYWEQEKQDWIPAADAGTGESSLVFTNQKKATASLKVKKILNVGPHGHHLASKTFTFTLTPDEGTEVQPAYNSITVEVTRDEKNRDAESWTSESALNFFDGIYFEKGTYTYTLDESETNPHPGVHYDHTKYEVVVDVTEAQDGSLQAVVTLDGQGTDNTAVAAFENSYEPTKASVTLQGRKVLEGGTFTRGEFTFVLSADKDTPWPDNPAEQQLTVGADGTWTYEVANASDKTFTFGRITFEKTGTYTYYISEKKDASRTDIAYDDASYKVTVVVEEGTVEGEDTHDGVTSMTRTVSYEKDGKPVSLEDGHVTFTNRIKTGNLTVSKTVTGNAGEPERDWHFTVTLLQDEAAGSAGLQAVVPASVQNAIPAFEAITAPTVLPAVAPAAALTTAPITGKYGDMDFLNGVATFTLKSGESKTATGLPADLKYTVVELEENQDGYATTSTEAVGVIADNSTAKAGFINHKESQEADPTPTGSPTAEPTAEPTATATPTATPTGNPTAEPTAEPTATATPTAEPTEIPTATPTAEPTAEPTEIPTATPTAEPTEIPTATPTAEPTEIPTATPTAEPTAEPTATPTAEPTATPGTEPEGPKPGRVEVLKKLLCEGHPVFAHDHTFYVALFEDPEYTIMASSVQPIRFINAAAATTVFDNLETGRTYYVAETDAQGNVLLGSGRLEEGIPFSITFANGNGAFVPEGGGTASVEFANEFTEMPTQFNHMEILEITKILLNPDGSPCNSDRTFYAGIFDDPELTQLSDQVNQNIVALSLNGASTVTVHTDVRACLDGEQITLYVAEVDENGRPVDSSADCHVTVENSIPVFDIQHGKVDTTIINQLMEPESETQSEPETETQAATPESETQPGTQQSETQSAPATGDATPIAWYLFLLISASAILGGIYGSRRRRNRNGNL